MTEQQFQKSQYGVNRKLLKALGKVSKILNDHKGCIADLTTRLDALACKLGVVEVADCGPGNHTWKEVEVSCPDNKPGCCVLHYATKCGVCGTTPELAEATKETTNDDEGGG